MKKVKNWSNIYKMKKELDNLTGRNADYDYFNLAFATRIDMGRIKTEDDLRRFLLYQVEQGECTYDEATKLAKIYREYINLPALA